MNAGPTVATGWTRGQPTKQNLWDFLDHMTAYIGHPEYRERRKMDLLNNFLNLQDPILTLCKDKVHPFYISKTTRVPVRLHFSCNRWSCDGCSLTKLAPYIHYLYIDYLCVTEYGSTRDTVYCIEVDAKANKTVRDKLSRLHMPRFTFSLKSGGLMVIMENPVVFERSRKVHCRPMTFNTAIRFLYDFDHSCIDRGFPNQLWTVMKVKSEADVEEIRKRYAVRKVSRGKNAWYVTVKSTHAGWYLPQEPAVLDECKEAKSHYLPNTSTDFMEYLAGFGIFIGQSLPDGMSDDDLDRIYESYVPARNFKIRHRSLGLAR